jgi:hypothetical protein
MGPKKQQATKQAPLKKDNEPPTAAAASLATAAVGLTDLADQQQEEFESLRAIYDEDFEQVHGKAVAWSVSGRSFKCSTRRP